MTQEVQQRSEEWFVARLGKITASRIADILATLKNGSWAASRKNYAAQLVTERLVGKVPEPFTNEAIQWGIDTEPQAREAYTKRTGNAVQEVGFVDHPTVEMAGASPDGLVGEDGLVEIKCPTTATHINTFLEEEIPERYKYQMMWQMACTKRKFCDFVSYDPRLPEEMQLFIQRLHYDEKEGAQIEKEVSIFQQEVCSVVNALLNKVKEKESVTI